MLTVEQRAFLRAQRQTDVKMRRAGATVIPYIVDQPAAINESTVFIEDWQPGQHVVDDVRMYQGIPYKCILTHDSGPNPHWTPDTQANLWMQYHGTSPETARTYIQPLGAHDAYHVDEYAIEGGVTYRCKVPATVYPPSTLPGNWEAVDGSGSGDTGGEVTEPEQPIVDEWPSWSQPIGSHDAYPAGAKVTYNGKHWINTHGDGNIWAPGVYGWTEAA